jgi:hypothetical protein
MDWYDCAVREADDRKLGEAVELTEMIDWC